MKKIIFAICIVLSTFSVANAAFPTAGASQNSYCIIPPYLTMNVKPNIDFVVDFTGSMAEKAYTGDYVATRSYYGNFKSNKYYQYGGAGYFEENLGCTDTDNIGSASACISGNLLNWFVMTRTDIIRKILTGGRIKTGFTDVFESDGYGYSYTVPTTSANVKLRGCKFLISAATSIDRKLTVSGTTCNTNFGNFSGFQTDVKTTTPGDITGIIQGLYPSMADIELAIYNTNYANSIYRVGKNKAVNNYVAAINSETATNGTNTGPALAEAQKYFKQVTMGTSANDTLLHGLGNYLKDPYYDYVDGVSLAAPCRKSFVLLISDGQWNSGSDPVIAAHSMNKNDLRSDLVGKQTAKTYTVYAFGDGSAGRQALITTALFGGYDDIYPEASPNGWPYPFTALPSNSLSVTYPRSECNPTGTWNADCAEWDTERTGLPYNFYEADDGAALQAAISKAVNDMLARTSSGTATSVVGNDNSSGAMLSRSLFFPEKQFEAGTKSTWLGETDGLWFYVSPSLAYINIREDTNLNKKLNLADDRVVSYDFDTLNGLVVNRFVDTNADGGSVLTASGSTTIDGVNTLWKVGKSLWSKTPADRTVFTNDPTVSTYQGSKINFDTSSASLLANYLDVASNLTDAENVIKYTRGIDLISDGYRSRTVTIDGISGNVWKLGDNINSTPLLVASSALNSYDSSNGGYRDTSYYNYISTTTYKNRGTVFNGANDGMLHAFKSGRLFDSNPITLKNPDGSTATDLGDEQWAFVPKNVLPYLKHLGNPSYKHMFYVDATPLVVDASIGVTKQCVNVANACVVDTCTAGITGSKPYSSCPRVTTQTSTKILDYDISSTPTLTAGNTTRGTSWRTVLLGSMGLGGATRDASAVCTNCVKSPKDGSGYSSYFALDVTNQTAPQLMWEFGHASMGYSTARPAVMRVKSAIDITNPGSRNGNWYAVLASGPTGPIDSGTLQMKGYSDQPLTVYVLDLKTGTPLRTFSAAAGPVISGVAHTQVTSMPVDAFAGRLTDSTIDTDRIDLTRAGAYSDDALYFGYTKKNTVSGKFNKGGVLRLLTGNNPDPSTWTVSTVIDNIGPVTSSVAKIQDSTNKALWLFWGTGRYYYKSGASIDEDIAGQQEAIYGVKDPCYDFDTNKILTSSCTTSILESDLTDQTSSVSTVSSGWKIRLATASGSFNAQRIISNPTATTTGILYFTAFKPAADICSYGGNTSLWAVNYSDGGAPSAALAGVAIVQVSTGATFSFNLKSGLTNSGGRESTSIVGVPSQDSSTVVSNSDHYPNKKILSIMEH